MVRQNAIETMQHREGVGKGENEEANREELDCTRRNKKETAFNDE